MVLLNSGVRCWDLNRSTVTSSKSIWFTLQAVADIKKSAASWLGEPNGIPAEDDDGSGGLQPPVGVHLDGLHSEATLVDALFSLAAAAWTAWWWSTAERARTMQDPPHVSVLTARINLGVFVACILDGMIRSIYLYQLFHSSYYDNVLSEMTSF